MGEQEQRPGDEFAPGSVAADLMALAARVERDDPSGSVTMRVAAAYLAAAPVPPEADERPEPGTAEWDAERERLTAPLGDLNAGHRVTLRCIAAEPDNDQYQAQWSGRLQGMAMKGLVWRFPDGRWQLTAYARELLAARPASSPSVDEAAAAPVEQERGDGYLLAEIRVIRDACCDAAADPDLVGDAWTYGLIANRLTALIQRHGNEGDGTFDEVACLRKLHAEGKITEAQMHAAAPAAFGGLAAAPGGEA